MCESVHFYQFRREKPHYFRTICMFVLLLLSRMHLWAYSIPEIVAKTKPAVVEIVAKTRKAQLTVLVRDFSSHQMAKL
jgi:hypothetical protein